MAYKSYIEKLRDPRWQRKRLEVMERAEFQCEACDSAKKTLNVHHRLYRKGANPWDYADHELECLCEDCHEAETRLRCRLDEALALLTGDDFQQVVGFAEGLNLRRQAYDDPAANLIVPSIGHAVGLAASAAGTDTLDGYNLLDTRCERIPGPLQLYRITASSLLSLVRDALRASRIARGLPETGL